MADLFKSISIIALVALSAPAHAQDGGGSGANETAQQQDQGDAGAGAATGDASGSDPGSETSGGGADGGTSGANSSSGAGDLSMGQPAEEDGPGTPYLGETFGDWEERCVRAEEGSTDPCQLHQLLRDENDNPVTRMSVMPLPEGREAAAGATVVTPLETLLSENVRLSIDGGQAKVYPFTYCTPEGCVARFGFTGSEVDRMKRGANATLVIVPVQAPDQEIALNISLSGFTAGYEALAERVAEASSQGGE